MAVFLSIIIAILYISLGILAYILFYKPLIFTKGLDDKDKETPSVSERKL